MTAVGRAPNYLLSRAAQPLRLSGSMADTLLLSPQEYYANLSGDRPSLGGKFHDIDDKTHFYNAMRRLEEPCTRNFVLDFGNEDAWYAADLDTEDVKLLLSRPVWCCCPTLVVYN